MNVCILYVNKCVYTGVRGQLYVYLSRSSTEHWSELLIINWVLTAYPVCMYRPDKQLGSRDLYIQYTRLAVLAAEWPLDARPFEEWPQITPTLNGNRPTGLLYGRLITEFLKIRLYCWKNFYYIWILFYDCLIFFEEKKKKKFEAGCKFIFKKFMTGWSITVFYWLFHLLCSGGKWIVQYLIPVMYSIKKTNKQCLEWSVWKKEK